MGKRERMQSPFREEILTSGPKRELGAAKEGGKGSVLGLCSWVFLGGGKLTLRRGLGWGVGLCGVKRDPPSRFDVKGGFKATSVKRRKEKGRRIEKRKNFQSKCMKRSGGG